MNKTIKILILCLVIFLFYKSSVLACGPYFPEYNYDTSQILNAYYPPVSDIGTTNYKDSSIINGKFEVVTPLWGPEYMLPVYLASKNNQLPDEIKNALVRYLYDGDYYVNLKYVEAGERDSVDSPILNGEKTKLTFWQKISSTFDDIFNKNKSQPEMEAEYKLAADEYHKGNYDKAIILFSKIYKNKKHINRDKAALSLGWSYIVKANQQYEIDLKAESKNSEENLIKNLKIAQIYYETIAADNSLSEVKLEIDKYLDYVLYRTDPVKRLTRAGNVMLTTSDPLEFLRSLNDYVPLWYKYFYNHIANEKETPKFEEYSKKINESGDEFSKFLLAWTDLNSNSLEKNLSNYKETNSPLWLILAQRQVSVDNNQWKFIDSEIKKINKDSPFYLTAQYFNLEAQSLDPKLINSIKESILNLISQTKKDKQYSSQNLFNGLMFSLSDGLLEKQKYSLMNYLGYDDSYWGERLSPPYYSYGGFEIGNNRPLILKEMKQILMTTEIDKLNDFLSNENIFNPEIKQYLRLVLFAKATINDKLDIAKNMAILLAKNSTEISKDILPFIKSTNLDEQKFLANKFLLNYPGITNVDNENFDEFSLNSIKGVKTIDNFRRNWMFDDKCPVSYFDEPKKEAPDSNSLSSNKIAKIIIDFSVNNPDNLSVPESLSKLIDLTHFGACNDKQSSEYSKRSFQILHNNYPNNYWTKQTPYWY